MDLDGTPKRFVAVADDGVVIPGEDVRASVAARLPRLWGFASAPQDLPGRYLGADRDGNVPPEIASAVRLAQFLGAREGSTGGPPRFVSVNLTNGPGRLLAQDAARPLGRLAKRARRRSGGRAEGAKTSSNA